MRYLKTKHFTRWARKVNVSDSLLKEAIREFEQGLYEANLGHHLFKKRISLHGRGKSGGARTILFYQEGKKLAFIFGFAKNTKDDLGDDDKKVLRKLSETFLLFSAEDIDKNIKTGELIEIQGVNLYEK